MKLILVYTNLDIFAFSCSVSPPAPETTNGSGMHGLSLERNPIEILETGRSISDIIDGKIRQLYSVVSIRGIVSFKFLNFVQMFCDGSQNIV